MHRMAVEVATQVVLSEAAHDLESGNLRMLARFVDGAFDDVLELARA